MRYPIVEYQDATDEVKAIYDDIKIYYSFVPNWYKTQALTPQILSGNWEKVRSTLYEGKVPTVLKQLVTWSISKARQCQYCESMHSFAANLLGSELNLSPGFKLTENLDNELIPSSYKVAVDVLTQVGRNPLETKESHYDALRDEGFSESEIRELFSQVGLSIFLNTFADIAGVLVDKEALSDQ